MVHGEVGTDFVAHSPALDVGSNSKDLSGHVGARDEVLLLAQRILALGYDKITVLYRSKMCAFSMASSSGMKAQT